MTVDSWNRGRMKWDTTMVAGGTPSTDEDSFWLDGDDETGLPFVSIADMSRRTIVSRTAKSLSVDGVRSRNMPVGRPGTLLLAMYASVGETAFLNIKATWNQALLGITVNPSRLDARFLYYLLLDKRSDLLREVRSNTQANLNASQVGDIWFQRPTVDEQAAIADYLDHETAQIDRLIGKQERLIETLRERRDAAWARLYETAGEEGPHVPVRRLVVSIVDGPFGSSLTSSHYVDEGARVIRLGNVGINEFKSADAAYVSLEYAAELSAHAASAGDVVIAGLGDDRMPLGRAAVVPDDLGPAIVKADCFRARPTAAISGRYLAWVLSAPQARTQMRLLSRGSTRARLNTSVVREVVLPVPTRDGQDELLRLSAVQTAKIDALISKAERFIEVSKERRSALITAAVTGQIDARDTMQADQEARAL